MYRVYVKLRVYNMGTGTNHVKNRGKSVFPQYLLKMSNIFLNLRKNLQKILILTFGGGEYHHPDHTHPKRGPH